MIQNQWYAILPSKKIKPGKLIGLKRLNMELALFRTATGELGCVVDQCTHRGVMLSAGKLIGECVQCPFHGLEFTTEGKCVKIPANGKEAFVPERFNVKAFPVREAHGIVYLWNGESDLATDTLPFFEDFLDDSFVYSEISDQWHTHYSRAIENQLDVVHLPFVHYNTIGKGNKTLVNGPKTVFINDTLMTSADNALDQGQKPKKPDQCEINPAMHLRFKFPNVWLNVIAPNLKVMVYFAPVDEENVILYLRFYHKLTPIKVVNQLIAFSGKFANLRIERQDKRVVITQKPKASSLKMSENLIQGDNPIVFYRKMRDELKQNLHEKAFDDPKA